MKRPAKYFFIFILGFCGLLIAGAGFLHFADLDPYREHIAGMATRATGRQVEINGHIDINLFPYPEVILNDVSLANAKWGSEPTMVSVGHAGAAISFPSLFSDIVIVKSLRLNDVIILLEQNDQQTGNWVLGSKTSSAYTQKEKTGRDPDKIVNLPVMIDSAELSNISITVREPERTDQVCHISSLSLQPDESGNLILTSSGDISGNPLVLNSRITSKESVYANGPVYLDLHASLDDAEITAQLSTRQLSSLAGLHGTLSISVQDIQKALTKAKIKALLTGPFTAESTIDFDGSGFRVTAAARVEGIAATVDGSYTGKHVALNSTLTPLSRAGELFDLKGLSADTLKLKVKGTKSGAGDFEIEQFQAEIGNNHLAAQGRINMDGDAKVSLTLVSPDLNNLFETLPAMDLSAKASAQVSAEKITVSDLAATFDKSDINGDVTVLKADNPIITANLTSKLLDLRHFSETSEAGELAKKAPPKGAAKDSHKMKAESKNRYVFKKAPFQLASLEGVEADVQFFSDHFYYDMVELKDVAINAAVHGNHVDAKFKCNSANDGHVAAKIDLKTQDKKAILDTVVSLSDFRMNVLASEGVSPADVPPVNVSLELTTAGSTPRELAAAANGRILLTQGPGKINNNMMRMFSSDILVQLVSALNPFAKNEKFSLWDCTIISASIDDGLATINGLLAQGEKVMIVGGGYIDLKTEELNVEFNTKPRTGVGIRADMFVTPFIKVQGTMANPGIGLNKKGTLLSGGAAFATGGMSLLLKGVYDRAIAEGDQCDKVLEAVGEHTRFSF